MARGGSLTRFTRTRRQSAAMPYMTCTNCAVLSYVPRSHVNPAEACPVCDTPLWERPVPSTQSRLSPEAARAALIALRASASGQAEMRRSEMRN